MGCVSFRNNGKGPKSADPVGVLTRKREREHFPNIFPITQIKINNLNGVSDAESEWESRPLRSGRQLTNSPGAPFPSSSWALSPGSWYSLLLLLLGVVSSEVLLPRLCMDTLLVQSTYPSTSDHHLLATRNTTPFALLPFSLHFQLGS
jgi:hypothetical protein